METFNWDQSTPEERREFLKKKQIYNECSGLEEYTMQEIEESGDPAFLLIGDALYFSK